jgi:hypothetical protein
MPEILARRRNARLSTGPRTKAGRRRASLNRRQLELPPFAVENLKHLQADPRDFQRVWRDVVAILGFMGPQMEVCLSAVAWGFWLRQHCARQGYSGADLVSIDDRLDSDLVRMVKAYRTLNRQWRNNLRREFGPFLEGDIRRFRMALELRLRSNQQLANQGQLRTTALEEAVAELAHVLFELEARSRDDFERYRSEGK